MEKVKLIMIVIMVWSLFGCFLPKIIYEFEKKSKTETFFLLVFAPILVSYRIIGGIILWVYYNIRRGG